MPTPKPKILVVEDEAIVAENLADHLTDNGYDIIGIVDSGSEAIAYAAKNAPDLVLMDIVLKGETDGIVAAEIISSQLAIPIVYMTAYGDDKTLERSKSAKPLAYLIKPFRPQALKAAIEIALNKHKLDQEQAKALTSLENLLAQTQTQSEFKSQFINMISHEFRNPLTNINLSTDILESQAGQWSEQKRQDRFQRIRKAIAQMTRLLDDALTISKIEAGNLSLQPHSFNLYNFCADLAHDLELALGNQSGNQYHIHCFSNQHDRLVHLDQSLMEYILLNLLSNAIKYSPTGGLIELGIKYSEPNSSDNSPDTVTLEVKDYGIGISAADQKQLFDPFFRSPHVVNIKGDGLGLSITLQLVKLLNGQIFVKSEQSTGSTFTVVLPLISS
ncbi:histidine kinase,Response regulator receiver domain protein,histidine kinase [Synechococcus sp. PCC 7502]|uniref:hybrid sensor histidine kinase/response regulator n=1 Tax=Synechococcus sp. PCC 7502 TaxID=1173263 RepID=UPI00029FE7F9|nr:ATP-binding protein [Synechococcus sp. PCC 7502]AFY75308.1 histidine kinase,Response regulator receiver domain protein,histidine kinase [Synechococcus sp. PCC 7502]